MKRPVILLIVASLLAGTSAFAAAANDKERFAGKVAEKAMRSKEAKSDVRQQRNEKRHEQRRDHRRDDRPVDRRHEGRAPDRRDHGAAHRPSPGRTGNQPQRGWEKPRKDWDRHPHYWDNRRHDRRDYAIHRYHLGHYHAPKGYYHRVWHRGDRLPAHWYARPYIVYDWRPYRLYAPPHGYHWVRVGNDVLLTAIATGIVLDVLYDIWF